ncbi:MAG: HAMP domain-containing protein [Phycisphaeraceae bacterium]|nr:HAMP domain-containing protein [Phycisphaeraceae bacterium]
MNLRHQLIALLAAMLVLTMIGNHLLQEATVFPAFRELEHAQATTDTQRCLASLNRELDQMAMTALDYAAWDDTRQFLDDNNEKYAHDNLVSDNFNSLKLDLISILRLDGTAHWSRYLDAESGELVAADSWPATGLKADDPLLKHADSSDVQRGLYPSPRGVMLVVSAPITSTNQVEPIHGSLVMGRLITPAWMEQLRNATACDVELLFSATDQTTEETRRLKGLTTPGAVALLEGDTTLAGYSVIHDIKGSPLMTLRVTLPRQITARGEAAIRTAQTAMAVGGVLLLLALGIALDRGLARPLMRLTRHVVEVRQRDDLTTELPTGRRDEIGRLAREFNAMTQALRQSRDRLAQHAHEAGMAEIATEVLHNVGNGLNAVGISGDLMDEQLRNPIIGLDEMVAVLQEHRGRLHELLRADNRGDKLIDFLSALRDSENQRRGQLVAEVQELRNHISEVKGIIAAQQRFAGQAAWLQTEKPDKILEDALRMARTGQLSGLTIQRRYDALPPVTLERTKLIQVLVNLIRNAMDAMAGCDEQHRILTLSLQARDDATFIIEVTDTGVGIDPNDLAKLFDFGFSTKADGHGYGLHYAQNAVRSMSGRLEAASGGPGQGATFTLTLPLCQQPQDSESKAA